MSCLICKVKDGGRHHYDCPYDDDNKNQKRVITWNASEFEVKTKYANFIKWRRDDGEYIVLSAQ